MRACVGDVFFPSKSTARTVSAGSQKEQAACHHRCLPAHRGAVPAQLFFFFLITRPKYGRFLSIHVKSVGLL